MPLVFNGTTIPENVANALMVNGVSITQVIANGVSVWNQSLGLTVGWSGDSISNNGYYNFGINTSGWSYRSLQVSNIYGAWLIANTSGLATGSSTGPAAGGTQGLITTPTTLGYVNSSSSITGLISFSTSTKQFTGSSFMATYPSVGYFTSGGLLAFRSNNGAAYGAWISLT